MAYYGVLNGEALLDSWEHKMELLYAYAQIET